MISRVFTCKRFRFAKHFTDMLSPNEPDVAIAVNTDARRDRRGISWQSARSSVSRDGRMSIKWKEGREGGMPPLSLPSLLTIIILADRPFIKGIHLNDVNVWGP